MSSMGNLQSRWRNEYFSISVMFAAVCLASEVILFIINMVLKSTGQEAYEYNAVKILVPTIFNLTVVGLTYWQLRSKKSSPTTKNIWVCSGLLLICCSELIVHSNHGALLCLPCVAVFMSVLFAEIKLTLGITIAGSVSIIIASLINYLKGDPVTEVVLEFNIALIIIWMSFVSSRIIVKYVRDQFFVIANSSNREKDLLYKLRLDPLMGIYNRGGMEKIMDQLIENYSDEKPMCMIMIDLDHFKKINDTYGHPNGDVVLMYLADIIGDLGRKNVVPCRYGGEEVVIILKDCTMKQAYERFMVLLEQFRKKHFDFAPNLTVTFSGGLSEYRAGMTKEEWIKKADENLYKAKHTGRNKIYPEYSFFYSISGRAQK